MADRPGGQTVKAAATALVLTVGVQAQADVQDIEEAVRITLAGVAVAVTFVAGHES
ncbi:hypothetical protein [Massilia sp. CT11-137]|uniref:hypothetical protein n=1 Tax=Massilia sp. CT11-137 TaxID=3393901 RepID=UPI0039B10E03